MGGRYFSATRHASRLRLSLKATSPQTKDVTARKVGVIPGTKIGSQSAKKEATFARGTPTRLVTERKRLEVFRLARAFPLVDKLGLVILGDEVDGEGMHALLPLQYGQVVRTRETFSPREVCRWNRGVQARENTTANVR